MTHALSLSPPGKAPGPDAVPMDLYKSNMDPWAPLLTNVLNSACKVYLTSFFVPVFKKGYRYPSLTQAKWLAL